MVSQAAVMVHQEFEVACDVFDEIKKRIVIIELVANARPIVREESIKILVKVLGVFEVIETMRKAGRSREFIIDSLASSLNRESGMWLRSLIGATPTSDALSELSKLAVHQHELVTAAMASDIKEMKGKTFL